MQNPPPNPQQNPPNYQPPYSQPVPPNAPPYPSYTQPAPPTQPPYPPYSQPLPPNAPPYPPAPYPALAPYPQSQDNTLALVLEAVLSFFGLYGIGWLIRGRTSTGILLLVGGFVWAILAIVLVVVTFGFGAICLLPIHIIFIVVDVVQLNNSLRLP